MKSAISITIKLKPYMCSLQKMEAIKIILKNGAQARNVWFVTGLDVTIGRGTSWNGNILAGRTATILDGSTVIGRVLAGASGAGAITLTGAASPSKTTITVPAN